MGGRLGRHKSDLPNNNTSTSLTCGLFRRQSQPHQPDFLDYHGLSFDEYLRRQSVGAGRQAGAGVTKVAARDGGQGEECNEGRAGWVRLNYSVERQLSNHTEEAADLPDYCCQQEQQEEEQQQESGAALPREENELAGQGLSRNRGSRRSVRTKRKPQQQCAPPAPPTPPSLPSPP